MTRIAIVGATGYTALDSIRILLRHPDAQIVALASRQQDQPHIAEVHPSLAGRIDLRCENITPRQAAERADCVFSCLPHGVTSRSIPEMLDAGARVVDFSADYRLNDSASFEQWYKEEHADAARLGKTPYGLPELFREAIRAAPLVANPGCYPTSAILPLAPLLRAGLIEPAGIIVDSKSGLSGAGRTPSLKTHFVERNEDLAPYNVGQHRHMPEIDQILTRAIGADVKVIFTPHLVPMDRGILSTIYAEPAAGVTQESLHDALCTAYGEEPFVRVVDHLPTTKYTLGTNFCDITVRLVRGRVVLISALDNMIKGASGAAVQNFNLMFGHPETAALL